MVLGDAVVEYGVEPGVVERYPHRDARSVDQVVVPDVAVADPRSLIPKLVLLLMKLFITLEPSVALRTMPVALFQTPTLLMLS